MSPLVRTTPNGVPDETVTLAQGHRVGLELLDEPEVSLRRLRGEEQEIPEPPTRGFTGSPAVEVLPAT